MARDLFGKERFDDFAEARQLDLPATPPIGVGRRCPDCKAGLEKTQGGFLVCPRGHGRLAIPPDYRQSTVAGMLVPHWTPSP